MPKPQKRKRYRFSTPPPVIAPKNTPKKHLETPQRSAVFAVLYFCEKEGIPCSLSKLQDHFNIPTSTASDVLRSKRARQLQNNNHKPDTRGAPRQLTNADANAIGTYINQYPFEEKGDT